MRRKIVNKRLINLFQIASSPLTYYEIYCITGIRRGTFETFLSAPEGAFVERRRVNQDRVVYYSKTKAKSFNEEELL